MPKRQDNPIYEHHLYNVWRGQKARCHNKNNALYQNYGGRGIKMSNQFKNDFYKWYNYVISLPNAGKKGYTIDRINNNKGYTRGNMRWATHHQQAANKRKYKINSTGFVGVVEVPIITKHETSRKQKYRAQIVVNYKTINLGLFDTPENAVNARNKYIRDNNLTEYKIQNTKS